MQKHCIYNFRDAKRGDTFNDVEFVLKLNHTPKDLTGCTIRMWFVDPKTNQKAQEFTTTNGGLVITDAVNGAFKTALGVLVLTPKKYSYDIEFDFIDGVIKTYISGEINIVNDWTK
jgi:hypothetical protein